MLILKAVTSRQPVFYLGISGGEVSPQNRKFPPEKKGTLQCIVTCSDVISPPPENINFPPRKYKFSPPENINFSPQRNTPMIMCWKTSSTTPLEISHENAPTTTPPRTYETSSTTPLEISHENAPTTTPPSNLRNFIDYPPSKLPPDMRSPQSMESRWNTGRQLLWNLA